MKKYLCFIFFIPLLFVLSCEKPIPHDIPEDYEYDPEKAGVDVLLNKQVKLDSSLSPMLAKDGNCIYLFDGYKIFVLNSDLNLSNTITIDIVIDLSVDISTYEYLSYGIIAHNDKIVTYSRFIIRDSNNTIVSSQTKYLQINSDSSGKKLVEFNDINNVTEITYNSETQKIMIFGLDSGSYLDGEYVYDDITDTYVYSNIYYRTGRFGAKFNSSIVWYEDFPTPSSYCSMTKHSYQYDGSLLSINNSVLKRIGLNYLHFTNMSDFVIDGEYLWLLSKKEDDNKYKIMKVEPLP